MILTDIGLDSSPSCYLCPRLGKRGSPISNHQLQIRYLLGEYMRHSINFLAALILVAVAATGCSQQDAASTSTTTSTTSESTATTSTDTSAKSEADAAATDAEATTEVKTEETKETEKSTSKKGGKKAH
ncbi:MAG: hypothetical protein QG574_3643 [Cyanobacteriota bacterium erpe_2018_sw_21hr_WHONDRS-SW48-000092_B_bin.40]|nr:hypothetical protein [Cyanobacteriota bacterium erpe_2018_sw_21hr_WHONDRS-SW48-000092_B_bin.40]